MPTSPAVPDPPPAGAASRLRARRSDGVRRTLPPGSSTLGLARGRDALVHVPPPAEDGTPPALVVLLHGAGSSGSAVLGMLAAAADQAGAVLLAPDSRGRTWDMLRGGFGPDVDFLDRALAHVLDRGPVDPARMALCGFSDGASYALSLGVANGDVFGHLIAFSPGFAAPDARVGRPRVFVTHGVRDRILPVDRCSRRLVPSQRASGYEVTYEEFEGGHEVLPGLARRALDWLSSSTG